MTNRLGDALSPYLQSHASNPVDWWQWGSEAFAEARRRDVPVFLSVGYAACHWCHVMAHESFEDPATASILNVGFVSIKVDREERPDVDATYMAATTALTGRGGWPMSVWLDHQGRPFYAGTYFPPTPRPGMPSFPQVLAAISDAWTSRRDELDAAAARITAAVRSDHVTVAHPGAVDPADATLGLDQLLADAVARLTRDFDNRNAGFGGAPKFPPSMVLDFLLRHHRRTGDSPALRMVQATCESMARGGMYDQLAGGFARYSVDDRWVVPHFEKMLYDNALLLGVYTDLYRATRSEFSARVVRETVEFLLVELGTPEGGFASALDADSAPSEDPAGQPVEGAFYSWTPAQLAEVLGESDGRWAAQLLDVSEPGTFEHGTSTLQLRADPDDAERWRRVRLLLSAARAERPRPLRDDKIVAAWNGLVIGSLCEAGLVFDEPNWVEAAAGAARLLRRVQWRDGHLLRVSRGGVAGDAPGVLEDYADVANGLLSLFAATGSAEWADFAADLLGVIATEFVTADGGLLDTLPDPDGLLPRALDPSDNAYPSGGSAAAAALVSAAALALDLPATAPGGTARSQFDSAELRSLAQQQVGAQHLLMSQHPRFAGGWLAVAEALVDGPWQVAVVGSPDDSRTSELVRAAALAQRPGMVLAQGPGDGVPDVGLLADRAPIGGVPTAYVCRGFVCELPVNAVADLTTQLTV